PKRMPPPTASASCESCTVSSSLPIPARNKQDTQPSSPLGVFSRTPPQVGQVEVCEGDFIWLGSHWADQVQKHITPSIRILSLILNPSRYRILPLLLSTRQRQNDMNRPK